MALRRPGAEAIFTTTRASSARTGAGYDALDQYPPCLRGDAGGDGACSLVDATPVDGAHPRCLRHQQAPADRFWRLEAGPRVERGCARPPGFARTRGL